MSPTRKYPSSAPPPRRESVAPPSGSNDAEEEQDRQSIADIALQLRDEQLHARVVHYRADMATSPELDRITAQVVDELRQLSKSVRPTSNMSGSAERNEALTAELTKTLSRLLTRVFRPGRVTSVVERQLVEASKRFARAFFESELHERIRGSATDLKTMRFPEQALYHVLARNEAYLARQLTAFDYEDPATLQQARDLLHRQMREFRDAFLSKTTPELNALVKLYNQVLVQFFTTTLPPEVPTLALEVVGNAQLSWVQSQTAHKVTEDTFPAFRRAFEHGFINRLVAFADVEMRRRIHSAQAPFRKETVRLACDPRIYSDVCELVCNAVYDQLYNDGFLDLPADWHAMLSHP
jgi:arsenate reductase-like glutaredoxin family protein